ncbi:autotransporter-associated N-terminal domain-containing protein [Sebaldella sp. S0638]|uniref:autotransporter-associated N-terminal domain-containing protein n=1 Tax=Sebaldella sp. S0638 TaxID=2957809 RepID=UPI0020A0713D|nr:autotransporter-associated N-terminal domain-containing protein [Sebaldella sp. S0638]MCP1223263.1 autotransporter-associated N-terminal domain-containing protein [Sebaldella sp. S0638]
MKNVLGQVEKRLKSCLKHNKKVKYSKALALTFLLTGGFLSADQAELPEDANFVKVSENLNKRIKELRQENKKKLKDSRLELERLEKEGDQVIKSPWDSYIFSSFFSFKDMDKKDKVWKYGTRTDTEQDRMRNVLGG